MFPYKYEIISKDLQIPIIFAPHPSGKGRPFVRDPENTGGKIPQIWKEFDYHELVDDLLLKAKVTEKDKFIRSLAYNPAVYYIAMIYKRLHEIGVIT